MKREEMFDILADLIQDALTAEHEETGKLYCNHDGIFPKTMKEYLEEGFAVRQKMWHEFYKLKEECC